MNHKDYLLGLLDGSQSVSNEGIGMVLERLDKLEAVVEAAKEAYDLSSISYVPLDITLYALEGTK